MNKAKFLTIGFFSILVINVVLYTKKEISNATASTEISIEDPVCMQMYYHIEKYSEMYGIPKRFAYGIAYEETRYQGPFDWDYNHKQTSSVGAIGPMQIMFNTAKWMWPKKRFTKEHLMKDIEFNVETSMKLLKYLHDKYGNWKLAFGAYNTGRPCVNRYAEEVYSFNPKWEFQRR
jgi:soluble lytic murein transglycosylase-like protein